MNESLPLRSVYLLLSRLMLLLLRCHQDPSILLMFLSPPSSYSSSQLLTHPELKLRFLLRFSAADTPLVDRDIVIVRTNEDSRLFVPAFVQEAAHGVLTTSLVTGEGHHVEYVLVVGAVLAPCLCVVQRCRHSWRQYIPAGWIADLGKTSCRRCGRLGLY